MQTFTNNLIFSLNATIPIFLMMALGFFLQRIHLLDDHTTQKLNQFAFKVLLPALLFMDLSTADFQSVWDTKFVLFCFCITSVSIGIAFLLSLLHRERADRGEFIQAAYRSSAAILGIAFVKNIYGEATMAALMIVGTVPLYNIIAVVVLSLTAPQAEGRPKPNRKALLLKTLKNVATNPIILGIVVGMLWSILRIPQPVILSKSVSYLGNMATPAFPDCLRSIVSVAGCKGQTSSNAGYYSNETAVVLCIVFTAGGCLWIPDRKADCHFGDVGQCNNWKLFCHGKKYGTSWNINRLFCYDDNPV